jgi:hypothetical protein
VSKKIGKYLVYGQSQKVPSGNFCGTARLVWDETDATCERLFHFFKEFSTAAEAEAHALEQVAIRVHDGAL